MRNRSKKSRGREMKIRMKNRVMNKMRMGINRVKGKDRKSRKGRSNRKSSRKSLKR